MKRRRLFVAVAVVVAAVWASVTKRAPAPHEPTAKSSAGELAEPVARAHADAPSADLMLKSADSGLDPELATERVLTQDAQDALALEPRRTLALIETADRRFGPLNEARRVLEIRALVALQMIGLSHSRAEHFYRTFPDSQVAREVERVTGYHRRPRGP